MKELSKENYQDSLIESIKQIDTKDLSDDVDDKVGVSVADKQKIYFWIRLYIKEENINLTIGDKVNIRWTPSGEELETLFTAYGKKGLEKDGEGISESKEDDKKIICLMVDSEVVNNSDDIPFIRTLFRTGNHYEHQLVRRDELIFYNPENGTDIEYYDCDF